MQRGRVRVRSWRIATAVGVLLVGATLANGCGGGNTKERLKAAELTESCLINSDCNSPLVCAFKRCHDACTTSRDCPDNQRCLASDRPFHVCQLEDETECVYHSNCPDPLVCGADGECRDQCGSGRDCIGGQVCTQGTCADDDELVEGKLPKAETQNDIELDGQPCVYSSECPSPMVCRVGLCRAQCLNDRDCEGMGVCRQGVCEMLQQPDDAPTHCSSRETDGDESDVDCGGSCLSCSPGASCSEDSDCNSQQCLDGVCQAPACSDGVRNGVETGEDCGGPNCDPCDEPPECEDSGDCADDEVCKLGACRVSACGNGAVDGEETGVDCGGPDCAACDHGARCSIDGDCASRNCDRGNCAQPTCTDGVENGGETDIDCGGPSCGLCANGGDCADDGDCASGVCKDDACLAPSCDDRVQNGVETDVDCGGVDCDPCASGKSCRSDNDCAAKQCLADVCGASFTLSVTTTGPGEGTVTSLDNRIQCGSDCSASFIEGTSVTLTAVPTSDSSFAGFSGACTGTTCVVAMDDDRSVTATFQTKEPSTGWAVNLSPGTTNLWSGGVAADGAGRSYVVGMLYGSADFGQGAVTSAAYDGYVAKYDASGALAWARTIGSANYELAEGVAVDAQGNVFVAGYVYDGNGYGGGTLTCNGGALGIAKLSATDGAHLASACVGGGVRSAMWNEYTGHSRRLALKSNGNPVFAVQSAGNTNYGSIAVTTLGYDWVVGEFSAVDLSVQHALALGSSDADQVYAIAAHPSDGSVVVAGDCFGLANLDAVPGERTVGGGTDVCVVKFDSSFTPVWARVFGGSGTDAARAVDFAANGDVFVAGGFESQLNYGGTGIAVAQSAGAEDAFVARLASADGAPIWAKDFGGVGPDRFTALAVDPSTGNVGLLAEMSSGVDFGSGALPYRAFVDVAFVLLDADGDTVDSAAAGTSTDDGYDEHATSIAANPAGGFLIQGRMSGAEGTGFGLPDVVLDHTFLVSLD